MNQKYKKLYSQLPVIIITDYNEISESFLYRYLTYYKNNIIQMN